MKSTGRAKYTSDLHPEGMLFGALLTSPHAHARVTSIDTSAGGKNAGRDGSARHRKAGRRSAVGGYQEIASVAAITEEIARDAVAQDQSEVRSAAAPGAGGRSRQGRHARQAAGEQVTGDPDQAFKEADAVSKATTAFR